MKRILTLLLLSIGAQAVCAQDAYPDTNVSRTYAPGDYFDENGIQGVVWKVFDDGHHGVIVSTDQAAVAGFKVKYSPVWSGGKQTIGLGSGMTPLETITGACSTDDGWFNICIIYKQIAAGVYSPQQFNAFRWCREKGAGWYLPAVDELLEMAEALDAPCLEHETLRRHINTTLKQHGGKQIGAMATYWSSTEVDARTAYQVLLFPGMPDIKICRKKTSTEVRAFHRF